jgi:phosphohistidine phosphatase
MRTLYLLRHAKSSWDDPGLEDRERPLAPRGRKAAKKIARWAEEHDVRPQLVLCSDALRARQTLERVLPALGDPKVSVEGALYAASKETLLGRVQTLPDEVEAAMLIGHNPGIADLVLALSTPGEQRARAAEKLPTGALATLRAEVERWSGLRPGSASLVAFVVPREL